MLDPSQPLDEAITHALTPINQWAEGHQLNTNLALADHIGYTCASREEFLRILKNLEQHAHWMHLARISGRTIAYAHLNTSSPSAFGPIRFLELSDQKPDGSQTSRFNHIEIVPSSGSPAALASTLSHKGIVITPPKRAHHATFDIALPGDFEIRIESEPLVQSLISEMRSKVSC